MEEHMERVGNMSTTPSASAAAPTPNTPLVFQAHPARAESARDFTGLETAMQSLALDARSSLALEIAATTEPTSTRAFFLRAESEVALQHLAAQVQSRYPQSRIDAVDADPLQLAAHDEYSAVELLPGAASYLPMRGFRAQDLLHEGVDPLLGILAAFNHLPSHARAVVQLALVPASPTWSAANRRLAIEHPLEQERQRTRGGQATPAPGMGRIAALFVLVVILVIASRFHTVLFPLWLTQAGVALVQGKKPLLSARQTMQIVGICSVLLALLFGAGVLFARLTARFSQPALYDQRLVAEKIARPAYRTRLRLFVIMPGTAKPLLAGQIPTYKQIAKVWLHAFKTSMPRLFRHGGHAFAALGKSIMRLPASLRALHIFLARPRPFPPSPARIWARLKQSVQAGKFSARWREGVGVFSLVLFAAKYARARQYRQRQK